MIDDILDDSYHSLLNKQPGKPPSQLPGLTGCVNLDKLNFVVNPILIVRI